MNMLLHRIERELKRPHLSRRQIWTRRITAGALLLGLVLMGAEIALRGFGYTRPQIDPVRQMTTLSESAESLNRRFETDCFEPDPYLLWKLRPGGNLGGITIDPRGLLAGSDSPGSLRRQKAIKVLCIGDSMTAVTYRTFPDTAERLIKAADRGPDLEFVNAAVPGYSSEQGIRWLDKLHGEIKPDVVVLCFGWNDHFPALNLPDRELGTANSGSRFAHNLLRDVRLYQFLIAPQGTTGRAATPNQRTSRITNSHRQKTDGSAIVDSTETVRLDKPAGQITSASHVSGSGELRVSPEQFAANLRVLIEMARAEGALPVLATQPENLTEVSQEHLQKSQFAHRERTNLIELHRQYNSITRQVAREAGVALMDLEEEFLRRKREHLFEPDGIHLTGRGHNHVARLLLALLRDEAKLSAEDYDAIARAERHDTTSPDKPRAAWTLVPPHIDASTTDTLRFAVLAHNAGNTRWIKENTVAAFGSLKNARYGSVIVEGRWRTQHAPTTEPVATSAVPSDILPGETTSVTLTAAAPSAPGNYEMQIGLTAQGIGELSLFGAETTTLTVTVR